MSIQNRQVDRPKRILLVIFALSLGLACDGRLDLEVVTTEQSATPAPGEPRATETARAEEAESAVSTAVAATVAAAPVPDLQATVQAAVLATQTARRTEDRVEGPPRTVFTYCTQRGQGGKEVISVSPPAVASKIHITMTVRVAEAYGYSVREVRVYGPDTGTTNLATGGDACASSVQDGRWIPEGVIDDDTESADSRWASEWQVDPQWLEVVLSPRAAIDTIEIYWEAAYAMEYCVAMIDLETECVSGF